MTTSTSFDVAAAHKAVARGDADWATHLRPALNEIERLQAVDSDGYVRGLRSAARWLAAFDQDLPGFDRETCRQLAKGMRAMVAAAEERLGVPALTAEQRAYIAEDVEFEQRCGDV